MNDLSAELSSLAFSFSDPERGFDRSLVKGMVAKLFTVKDPAAMTALEVSDWLAQSLSATSRMYFVSEIMGKKALRLEIDGLSLMLQPLS